MNVVLTAVRRIEQGVTRAADAAERRAVFLKAFFIQVVLEDIRHGEDNEVKRSYRNLV